MDEQQQQEQPDYAGRKDLNDLVQAYRQSGVEAVRQKERADRAEQMLQQMAANPRPDLQMRPANPADRLAEFGIPTDALDEYVNQRLNQAFQPITQGLQARNHMLANYGQDYSKFESDVASFISQDAGLNQTYQRMFAADPQGAMEFAFLKYGEARRKTTVEPTDEVRERKSQAQIPSARQGESRNTGNQESEYLQRAFEHYQKTGNPTAYAKARLRGTISKRFYETGHPGQ